MPICDFSTVDHVTLNNMGQLFLYTQQLRSISVNHSPNPTPNANPNLTLHKSAVCIKLLFQQYGLSL